VKIEWVPLGDILTPRGGVPVEPATSYPVAGVYGFGRGVLVRGTITGLETGYKTLTRLTTGDVVYSKLKAFEGAIACVHKEADGRYVSPEFPVFSVDQSVSWRYLEHVLQSPLFMDNLASASTSLGARRERVHPSRFLELRVPLPHRSKQDRIAAHLSALGSGNTASSPHMKVALRHLIAQASADAPRKPIGELMRSSRLWIELDDAAPYHPIGVRGFGRGMIRYPEVSADALSKLRYYPVEPGALIVSNIKAWEGAVCLAEVSDAGKIASNRFLQYVPTSYAIIAPWVEQYLLSAEGIASLGAASPGSADRNRTLSMGAFEAIEIPVPLQRIQQAVVNVAQALRQVQAQEARRDRLAAAILPAARNEIFYALR
jgi:type I restriction enzyme, S subunit